MLSPSIRVAWPTETPATSVIALPGPGENTPGARPISRARGRDSFCALVEATASAAAIRIGRHFMAKRGMIRFSRLMRQIPLDAILDAAQHVYKAAVRTPLVK